jgi:hypothetical protein
LIILVAFLLSLGAQALGIPLAEETMFALAAALVAWLLGIPAGARVAAGVRSLF